VVFQTPSVSLLEDAFTFERIGERPPFCKGRAVLSFAESEVRCLPGPKVRALSALNFFSSRDGVSFHVLGRVSALPDKYVSSVFFSPQF